MSISMMDGFVAITSKSNVFKYDLVDNLRKNDNMVETLEELCKIIANTMRPNIQYLGHKRIDQRIKYPQKYVQMYDSDIYCEQFEFKVNAQDEYGRPISIYKNMIFEIPNLIDGCKYMLNGVYFYPTYQLVDATTYHRTGSVNLKTLTIPIKMDRIQYAISDINGREYLSYVYTIEMQKKKVNVFAFFFATMGALQTIKFFEGPETIFHIISEDKIDRSSTTFTYFKITKLMYLSVLTEVLKGKNAPQTRAMVAGILDVFPNSTSAEQLLSIDYWRYDVLSQYFAKGKTLARSTKLDLFIEAYKRLYDSITKENMNIYETPKENIYEVLRWMFMHYTELLYRDNNSIFRKRIKLSESQIAPIIRRELYKMNRVIHSRNRFKDIDRYAEILTLPYKFSFDAKNKKGLEQAPSDILVKAIINSSSTRYAESVNDMDIFNILLKFCLTSSSTTVSKGPRSNSLSKNQRHVSLSQISFISPSATGAGDPGSTGVFIPFALLEDGRFISPFKTLPKKE